MEKILNVKIHNQTEEVASKAKNEARNTAKNPHMAMFVLFAVLFNILAFVVPANTNDLWGSRMSAYKVGCGIGCAVLAWCLLHLRDIIREPSLIGLIRCPTISSAHLKSAALLQVLVLF